MDACACLNRLTYIFSTPNIQQLMTKEKSPRPPFWAETSTGLAGGCRRIKLPSFLSKGTLFHMVNLEYYHNFILSSEFIVCFRICKWIIMNYHFMEMKTLLSFPKTNYSPISFRSFSVQCNLVHKYQNWMWNKKCHIELSTVSFNKKEYLESINESVADSL